MLIAIVLGAVLGLAANTLQGGAPWLMWVTENVAQPVGQLFLRLLFMLVIPMLFSALVLGVSELDMRHLGRLGVKTLLYTAVVSFIAVAIGMTLVNVVGPGHGASDALRAMAKGSVIPAAAQAPGGSSMNLIIAMVPDNVVKAAAAGDMI